MEASAEAILAAAAQSEVVMAPEIEQITDDDRSSSLSELDEEAESAHAQLLPVQHTGVMLEDDDSEAETERIEDSPDKLLLLNQLAATPSKLRNAVNMEDDIHEDKFSDSAISSPISSVEDQLTDDDDVEEAIDNADQDTAQVELLRSAMKRKRSLLADLDIRDPNADDRLARKRTRSIRSEDDDGSEASDAREGRVGRRNRGDTVDIEEEGQGRDDASENSHDEDEEQQEDAVMTDAVADQVATKTETTRRALRRKPGSDDKQSAEQQADSHVGDAEDSEEDTGEGEEVDDAEATAKSEEEYAKRMAAMEALTTLERHFATLRDRLYDERIAAINNELKQAQSTKITHPQLLQQIDCVEKHRDNKFSIEQKLLVYKIGALKRKSVAERSQIHSAYFQTVRDIRERHLEQVSKHFYRIQRDRFKTDNKIPEYSIPFPEKRSVQISQQTAYNKEVSVLSGVAKYVGFPAAPSLPNARQSELEEDLEKMGISAVQVRLAKQVQKTPAQGGFMSAISRQGAEEQFLEQTPWANPQHPVHRQRLQMSRQASQQSQTDGNTITPAHQQRPANATAPVGSASTIVENASAQVSSANNTPHDDQADPRNGAASVQNNYRLHSTSPFDMRRRPSSTLLSATTMDKAGPQHNDHPYASSPLAARTSISSPKTVAAQPDRIPRQETASPSLLNRFGRESAITPISGLSRFSVR